MLGWLTKTLLILTILPLFIFIPKVSTEEIPIEEGYQYEVGDVFLSKESTETLTNVFLLVSYFIGLTLYAIINYTAEVFLVAGSIGCAGYITYHTIKFISITSTDIGKK